MQPPPHLPITESKLASANARRGGGLTLLPTL